MNLTPEVLGMDIEHRHDRLRKDASAWRAVRAGRPARAKNRQQVRRLAHHVTALTGLVRRA